MGTLTDKKMFRLVTVTMSFCGRLCHLRGGMLAGLRKKENNQLKFPVFFLLLLLVVVVVMGVVVVVLLLLLLMC